MSFKESTLQSVDRRLCQSRVSSALFALAPTPVEVGPYQLVRRVGVGGMGIVYEAVHRSSAQRLALKMLRAEGFAAVERLKREFRLLSALDHPNLVRLYEIATEVGATYLTMELVDGQPFFDHVHESGVADVTRVSCLFRQFVDAVAFLHSRGVVHRDLKPSNLLVTPGGRLVVLDFGLARSSIEREPASMSGTMRYMAPERLRGMPADQASDWYSVGVIVAETLTGLCRGSDALSQLRVHDDGHPLRRELAALCARLTAPDPGDRPRADELRESLGMRQSM